MKTKNKLEKCALVSKVKDQLMIHYILITMLIDVAYVDDGIKASTSIYGEQNKQYYLSN